MPGWYAVTGYGLSEQKDDEFDNKTSGTGGKEGLLCVKSRSCGSPFGQIYPLFARKAHSLVPTADNCRNSGIGICRLQNQTKHSVTNWLCKWLRLHVSCKICTRSSFPTILYIRKLPREERDSGGTGVTPIENPLDFSGGGHNFFLNSTKSEGLPGHFRQPKTLFDDPRPLLDL